MISGIEFRRENGHCRQLPYYVVGIDIGAIRSYTTYNGDCAAFFHRTEVDKLLAFISDAEAVIFGQLPSHFGFDPQIENLMNGLIAQGIYWERINESGTSSTCPRCGEYTLPKNRAFLCWYCGFREDRDIVGAMNIRARFLYQNGLCASPFNRTVERPAKAKLL